MQSLQQFESHNEHIGQNHWTKQGLYVQVSWKIKLEFIQRLLMPRHPWFALISIFKAKEQLDIPQTDLVSNWNEALQQGTVVRKTMEEFDKVITFRTNRWLMQVGLKKAELVWTMWSSEPAPTNQAQHWWHYLPQQWEQQRTKVSMFFHQQILLQRWVVLQDSKAKSHWLKSRNNNLENMSHLFKKLLP